MPFGLQKKQFRGSWLTVSEPVDPELLIWHNLAINNRERFWRGFAFAIFFLCILSGTFASVVYLENQAHKLENRVPDITCASNITSYQANIDAV